MCTLNYVFGVSLVKNYTVRGKKLKQIYFVRRFDHNIELVLFTDLIENLVK